MAKEHGKSKVDPKLRLLKMKAAVKDEDFYRRRAIALLDEVMEATDMTTGEVIQTLFSISHLFLDVGQSILASTLHDDDEEAG